MNSPTYQQIALRFAQVDGRTKAGAILAERLSPQGQDLLWADDPSGNFFIAGLNLLAAIGPLQHSSTIDHLLEAFPDWWKLDATAAKVIARQLDRAIELDQLDMWKKDVEMLAEWLTVDAEEFPLSCYPMTWTSLCAEAHAWMWGDEAKMRADPRHWTSELPSQTHSYYTVTPIQCTAEMLAAAQSVSKSLRDRALLDLAVAGTLRIFTVNEVHTSDVLPAAAILIEKVGNGWTPRQVFCKGDCPVPQRLYQLAFLLASQYQSRSHASNSRKAARGIRSMFDVASLIESIILHATGRTHDLAGAQSATSVADASQPIVCVERRVLLVDTSTLLDSKTRHAVNELVRDVEGRVIVVGSAMEKLSEGSRGATKRDADAALACIKQWIDDGKANIEGPNSASDRPDAGGAILQSIGWHINRGELVTLITVDSSLRTCACRAYQAPRLMTIDAWALVEPHHRVTTIKDQELGQQGLSISRPASNRLPTNYLRRRQRHDGNKFPFRR